MQVYVVKYRGDNFRKSFAEIGIVRSLIPTNVNILALTATATKETADILMERLCMTDARYDHSIRVLIRLENVSFNQPTTSMETSMLDQGHQF